MQLTSFEIYNRLLAYQQKANDVKDEQKHFILAMYADICGSRVTENIAYYSSIVIDFDYYPRNYEALKEELQSTLQGINYLFYTTSSHSLEKPRIRLIIFTNRDFLVSEKNNIMVNLTQNFSTDLIMSMDQGNSFGNNTLSRLPFKSPDFQIVYNEGKPYFIGDDVNNIKPNEVNERAEFEKEFKTLTNNLPISNLTEKQIEEYLDEYKKHIGFNEQTGWVDSYDDWLAVGMILHHQYQGSDVGLLKWEKWCCESSKNTKYAWGKFKDSKQKPKTFKTIIKALKKNNEVINTSNSSEKIKGVNDKILVPIEYFPDQKEPNKQGKIVLKNTYDNFKVIVDFYKLELGFDVITKNITLAGEFDQNKNIVKLKDLLIRNNISADRASEYQYKYAMDNKYNSFYNLITTSKWDGVCRLEDFYNTIKVKPEYEKDKRIYLHTWLKQFIYLACFSTVYPKESKEIARYVLVLQSQQEGGKSTWVKNLLPPEMQSKYVSIGTTLKTDDDQHILGIVRKLIVEMGEVVKSFKHSDVNAFKAFFGRTVDTLKVKWVTFPIDYERTTSFIASTNDYYFLNDDTGATRFLILPLNNDYRTPDNLAIFCNGRHNIDMLQLYRQVFEDGTDGGWVNFHLSEEDKAEQKIKNETYRLKSGFEEIFSEEFTDELSNSAELFTCTQVLRRLGYPQHMCENKKLRNDVATFLRNKGFPCRKDGPKWRLVTTRKEVKEDEHNIQKEDY